MYEGVGACVRTCVRAYMRACVRIAFMHMFVSTHVQYSQLIKLAFNACTYIIRSYTHLYYIHIIHIDILHINKLHTSIY